MDLLFCLVANGRFLLRPSKGQVPVVLAESIRHLGVALAVCLNPRLLVAVCESREC